MPDSALTWCAAARACHTHAQSIRGFLDVRAGGVTYHAFAMVVGGRGGHRSVRRGPARRSARRGRDRVAVRHRHRRRAGHPGGDLRGAERGCARAGPAGRRPAAGRDGRAHGARRVDGRHRCPARRGPRGDQGRRLEVHGGRDPARPGRALGRQGSGAPLVGAPHAARRHARPRADGTSHDQEIVVRAVPLPVWLDVRSKHRLAAMEQLVRALGQDPARVLGSAS
jgi:hypothetical protein